MKKLMALALALIFVLSLAACSGKDSSGSNNNKPSESSNSDSKPSDSSNSDSKPSDSSNSDSKPSDSGNSNNTPSAPLVSALENSKIFVDLEEVKIDVPLQTADDVVMVPVQAIMEAIGYDVNWLPEELRLEVWEPSRQHPTIILTIGNTTAYYEKYAAELDERVSYEATLASPPIVIDEILFAPLIFVAEAVGYTIDDSVDTSDIYLFSPYYLENQIGEGIGEDQPATDDIGEGIGETQPLTEDEMNYVLSIRTESWLALEQEQKEEVLSIMARWWDIVDGYIVEDFDAVLADLDHQMETYFRNSVDEGILQTACDIYSIDVSKYVQ